MDPMLRQISMNGFSFAPRGWALCDGQILPINQNQSLYSLLGTTFGGDGRTSFGLPDLRGRTPVHPGNMSGYGNIQQGSKPGRESVTLSTAEIPSHRHQINVDSTPPSNPAAGHYITELSFAATPPPAATVDFNYGALANTGGSQSHNNMQPYTVISFCIALQGVFPSRS